MIEYTVKVYADGAKEWRVNDKLHREDGPAYEGADGTKFWYRYGKRSREDGPAVIRAAGPSYGTKEWWIDGKKLSEAEFNQRTNSCNGKIVEIEGKKYELREVKE